MSLPKLSLTTCHSGSNPHRSECGQEWATRPTASQLRHDGNAIRTLLNANCRTQLTSDRSNRVYSPRPFRQESGKSASTCSKLGCVIHPLLKDGVARPGLPFTARANTSVSVAATHHIAYMGATTKPLRHDCVMSGARWKVADNSCPGCCHPFVKCQLGCELWNAHFLISSFACGFFQERKVNERW